MSAVAIPPDIPSIYEQPLDTETLADVLRTAKKDANAIPDGVHREVRGCKASLNGGIEMPMTACSEARVNTADITSERGWVAGTR
jgi:hypothetical protein